MTPFRIHCVTNTGRIKDSVSLSWVVYLPSPRAHGSLQRYCGSFSYHIHANRKVYRLKPTTHSLVGSVVYTKIFHSVNSLVHCAAVASNTKRSNRCKSKPAQKTENIKFWRADFVILRPHTRVSALIFQTQYHTNSSMPTVEKWHFPFVNKKTKGSVFPLLNYISLSQNYQSSYRGGGVSFRNWWGKSGSIYFWKWEDDYYTNTCAHFSINTFHNSAGVSSPLWSQFKQRHS